MNMMEGTRTSNAVVMATGGAGRVYRYNTNGGIVTGDGMGNGAGYGVPLRYGIRSVTRSAPPKFRYPDDRRLPRQRVFWSIKNGYRYPQDYGMGPETPLGEPKQIYGTGATRQSILCFLGTNGVKATPFHAARRCNSPRPASSRREETA